MFSKVVRRLLFLFEPETAHRLAIWLLKCRGRVGVGRERPVAGGSRTAPTNLMGLQFPNRIGLAAGFDKNAEAIDGLASLGFGHIEVGTVTPRPQKGNPKPRLFRLTKQQAIINRMGFNNVGVTVLVKNIKRSRYKGILGINIGKNADTPIENAADDYVFCLRAVYVHASYIVINISSPNTANLRRLQMGETLAKLLQVLKRTQQELSLETHKYVPLVVKIAPDLSDTEIVEMAQIFLAEKIDGVIATNTTATEKGGLSGAPLTAKSTHVIKILAQQLQGAIPIIAAGGIMSAADAAEKLQAGASLVQVYTGFIYEGPTLIEEISKTL
jgi:dihydroorotate dehydrogenase